MQDTPEHPALAAWLAPLSDSSRRTYSRAVDVLAWRLQGSRTTVAELLTAGDLAQAALAIEGLAASEIGLAAHTVRTYTTALCGLARWAGRDLGLRRPVGRPRGATVAGPPHALAEALTAAGDAWAAASPALARAARKRGTTAAGLIAEALAVLAAERSGPGLGILRAEAGRLAAILRPPRKVRARAERRAIAAKVPDLDDLALEQEATLAELERAAATETSAC